MDFALGLSLAYMKILSLAAVIMVIVWLAAKVSLALHQQKIEKPDQTIDTKGDHAE